MRTNKPSFEPIPNQRALAVIPPPKDRETAFQAFMEALSTPYEEESIRLGLAWADLPLEDLVLFGVWPIFERVSERLGDPLTSITRALDEVAPRSQRLIDAGLLLTYASPFEAAQAFRKMVLLPLQANLEAAVRRGERPVFRALALPLSFAFFRQVFAAGKRLADEVETLTRRVKRENLGEWEIRLLPLYVTHIVQFRQYLDILTGPAVEAFPLKVGDGVFAWQAARRQIEVECQQLRQRLRLQAALRGLPTRLAKSLGESADPFRYRSADYSYSESWLSTQLLLAAKDGDDAEWIWEHERVPLQEAAYALDDATLIKRLWARLRARRWSPSASDEAVILDQVRAILTEHRANRYRTGLHLWHAITRIDVDAYMRVQGATALVNDTYLSDAKVRDVLETQASSVADKVDWPSLQEDEVEELIAGGRLPLTDIVTHFAQLAPNVRAACLPNLRQAVGRDRLAYSALVRLDYVHLEIAEALEAEAFLTNDALLACTQHALLTDTMPTEHWVDLLRLLEARRLRRRVRALLARPDLRRRVAALFNEECLNAGRLRGQTLADFRALLGNVLWRRYVFGCEVYVRAHTFRDPPREELLPGDQVFDYRRWRDLRFVDPESSFASIAYDQVLGVPAEEFPHLLRVYSERRSFFWLYADKPNLEMRWRAYLRGRKIFFRVLAASKAHFGLVRDQKR